MPLNQKLKLILIIPAIAFLAVQCGGATEDKEAAGLIEGNVLGYKGNRIGDVDKVVVEADAERKLIHFPPHTARVVMQAAPQNHPVSLTVHTAPQKGPEAPRLYELISIKTSSGNLSLNSLPPMPAATGKEIQITGKSGNFRRDDRGSVTALIINQYIVELPPHLVKNLLPAMSDTAEVIVKGYERNDAQGFVNTTGLTVIRPYAISINNIDYLL